MNTYFTVNIKNKLLFLLLLLFSGASAQPGKMFSVDVELSNSLIYQVYQDSKGLVWVATEDGLNRYDGSKFTIYKHDQRNPASILNNYVRLLFEDSKGHLLVGYFNGLQLYDHATDSFRQIRLLPEDGKEADAHVLSITERENGEILIGTSGFGVFSLTFEGNQPVIQQRHQFIPAAIIDYLFEDREQRLWVATQDKGLFLIDRNGKTRHFRGIEAPSNTISGICQDRAGNVYVSSLSNGLFMYKESVGAFQQIPYPPSPELSISTMHMSRREGKLYLGTDGEGVKIYDLNSGTITEGNFNVATFNLLKSKVHSILEDQAGNLWLGIYQKGVLLLPANSSNFKYVGYKSVNHNTIGSNAVLSVHEDHEGTRWVGTDSDGLYAIDLDGEQIAHFDRTASPSSVPSSIMSIYEDSDQNLWLGSYLNGLAKLDRSTGKCDYITALRDEHNDPVERVYSILEDRHKTVWIGTMGAGLFSMDLRTQKLTHYYARPGASNTGVQNHLPSRWINCLLLTSKNKLYIGTYDGIGCLDLETKNFASTHGTNRLLQGSIIYALHEDPEGNIWIGTSQGLMRLEVETNKIKTYTMEDGLPSNVICAVKGDKAGRLWISTNYGVTKLDPKKNSFISYYANDGLQGNEFSKGAAYVDSKGQIIFGGINGITLFNPADIPDNPPTTGNDLNVRITGFYLHNQAVKKGMRSGPYAIVNAAVMEADSFHLSHKDNSFSMELSAMDFANPERITYQYSLQNEEWITLRPGTNTVNFTDLTPGTYRFRFRARNYSDYSDVREVTVVISPAWYFSPLAKFFYGLILAAVLLLVWLQVRHRLRTRQKMLEHQHAKQIIDAKLQFFINISHEIRTPMTLIISPLKKLISTDKDRDRQQTYLTMQHNAERILHLINQLMDIRKIDKGQMQLKFQKVEIVGFIRKLCAIFEEQSQTRNIGLHLHRSTEQLPVWVDPDYFDKAVLNVLSNAFKFTPDGGNIDIYLQTGEDDGAAGALRRYVELIVSDSGIGIPYHELKKVFECFYQVRTSHNHFAAGTGIGLSLTQSIVALHHGSIRAENNNGAQGCRFVMRFPLGKDHLKPEELMEPSLFVQASEPAVPALPAPVEGPEEFKVSSKTNMRVLVVDDDKEIRKYICRELSSEFHMTESANGKEALSAILEKAPHLIISDVMMPEMDGITLCRKIKQNVNVNHIPVVLLTAKAEEEDTLEGLGIGADAYMVKPFNIDILKKTVQNIIRNRDMLRNNFSGNQDQRDKVQKVAIKSADEKLLNKLLDIINRNMDNPALSVEMIAGEIGISRVHLHRKMKEITNQSTRDFIRNVRLQQAADLLSSKHLNISEVAFAVGFTSLASFSTAFKDLYGVPPTTYMESHLNQYENAVSN
ncbi:signal transduction histidine kinase [Pontibacter ummariensis]|uniref:histidine kinase n=1 Tax=Pontibacter ummariensis TaxID=1610492 RepID=A0A239K222_9BACT|nr:hybrid sensor histidine kinase/response regulator transcription factor [Pontibacter ummariensis]PRY06823.1 signal transduction histidine kinase [Pontibacter ummariensis]SNT11732.1 Signal transduction histidine kinase [Pontibacter ummariensis]